jgi:hypothetical protein
VAALAGSALIAGVLMALIAAPEAVVKTAKGDPRRIEMSSEKWIVRWRWLAVRMKDRRSPRRCRLCRVRPSPKDGRAQ